MRVIALAPPAAERFAACVDLTAQFLLSGEKGMTIGLAQRRALGLRRNNNGS